MSDMSETKKKVCIVGAGTWGCAMAHILSLAGADVTLVSASGKSLEEIRKHGLNDKLPVPLSKTICFEDSLESAVQASDIIFLATKSDYVRTVAKKLKPIAGARPIVSLVKGLDPDTGLTVSEVLSEDFSVVCVLSGGSHAEEVIRGLPFSLTLGIPKVGAQVAGLPLEDYVFALFKQTQVSLTVSRDMKGIEIAAALKNIIAIAVGISDGLELGDNFRSTLIVSGLKEIAMLGDKLNFSAETIYGNAGLGDLLATALSRNSRNRNFGFALGKGQTVEQALKNVGMVVEGMKAVRGALCLSKQAGIRMPFVETVKEIAEGRAPVSNVIELGR